MKITPLFSVVSLHSDWSKWSHMIGRELRTNKKPERWPIGNGGAEPSITPVSITTNTRLRSKHMTNVKAANWVYTWNNPNVSVDAHHASLSAVDPSYHVFQREMGANGTPHFQGYVEFRAAKSLKSLKACNPQIHWEKRHGTQQQADAYCRKHCSFCYDPVKYKKEHPDFEGEHSDDVRLEGPWSFGERKSTAKAGMSPDFVDQIKAGKRMRDLLETHVDDVRKYPRFYQQVRCVHPPPQRDGLPDVYLLYGDPGTGKSRYVREREQPMDLFIKPVDRAFWMDGYDGHDAVLFDDFTGAANHVSLVNLLQLIDRYQMQVPIKGGFTWWQPARIYITTNVHPANWYEFRDRMVHYEALQRRFTDVIVFGRNSRDHLNKRDLMNTNAWDAFWSYSNNHVERTYGAQ